jgi:hypothetical protein
MKSEATEIEVEVVEVDGVAPVPAPTPPDEAEHRSGWRDWRGWQGRVRTLDSRWWPLWVLLGGIALFLLLTLGLVIAVVYVAVRLVSRLLRALFR